jgi:hypothetical protein
MGDWGFFPSKSGKKKEKKDLTQGSWVSKSSPLIDYCV